MRRFKPTKNRPTRPKDTKKPTKTDQKPTIQNRGTKSEVGLIGAHKNPTISDQVGFFGRVGADPSARSSNFLMRPQFVDRFLR